VASRTSVPTPDGEAVLACGMSWLSLTPYPAPDSAASGAAPDLFERFRRNVPRRPVLEFIEPCLSELAVLILNVIGAVAQIGRPCPMLRRSGARFEVAGRIVGVTACDWQAREATGARHSSPFVPHAEPRTRPPRVKSDAGVRASPNTRPIPSSQQHPLGCAGRARHLMRMSTRIGPHPLLPARPQS
jgi:hypothetical protein